MNTITIPFAIASLFVIFAIVERLIPLREQKHPRLERWVINLLFGAVLFATAIFTLQPTIHTMTAWTAHHQFGLLPWLSLPVWAEVVVGCLLMDLTFYYWHRLNHEWPLLWRFHQVHHIDPDMDVTTAMRFHCVEVAYSSVFRVVQLGLIGLSPLTFLLYEFLFQANTYFHHSNIRLPMHFECLLNRVWVTPRMHGIHHSQVRAQRNQNYGSVFTFWDRLHRTLLLSVPQENVRIGVDAFTKSTDNRLLRLLWLPFVRQP